MKEGGKMNKAGVKKELKGMFDDYIERGKPEHAIAIANAMHRLGVMNEKEYDRAGLIALETYDKIHYGV